MAVLLHKKSGARDVTIILPLTAEYTPESAFAS